jgi:tetratricopeptide (TPR) repeat protein
MTYKSVNKPFMTPAIRELLSILMLWPLIMAAGCASLTKHGSLTKQAEQQYQDGRLDDAVGTLVAALKHKPDYLPADALLRQVAGQAYDTYEKRISQYESGGKFDQVVAEYDALIRLSELVEQLPGSYPIVDVKVRREKAVQTAAGTHFKAGQGHLSAKRYDQAAKEFMAVNRFISDYKESKSLAARAYYEEGKVLAATGKFRDAAKSFKNTLGVVPGYQDASERYEQARTKAIVRVAVMPLTDASGRRLGDKISDDIVSNVMGRNPEFIELVTRDHLAGLLQEKGLNATDLVDQSSAMKTGKMIGVDSFIYGRITPYTNISREQVQGPYENAVKQTTGSKKAGTYREDILSVRYWIHSRSSSAKLSATYQIIDAATGRIKQSKSLSKEKSDLAKWVTYQGVQQIIPQSAFIGVTGERDPADPETLLEQAIQSISSEIADEIVIYFE